MTGSVIIIPADQRQPITSRDTDQQPTLQQLQDIVDGYIQQVPGWATYLDQPCVVFCNEDGKHRGLPPNRRATNIWYEKLFANGQRDHGGDFLVGDVVVLVNLPDNDDNEV